MDKFLLGLEIIAGLALLLVAGALGDVLALRLQRRIERHFEAKDRKWLDSLTPEERAIVLSLRELRKMKRTS